MWRTCGAIPSTPLASSARRCSTPKRCCSSTTQRPSRAKRDRRLDQRVGAHDQPQLAAGELVQGLLAGRRRRRPGQQRERDRLRAEQPAEGRPRAARRGSRSAPSAPPGSRLRARAASRRRRRRSSPSRPRPSAAAASARRSRGRRRSRRRPASWSAVGSKGSDSSQRPTSSPGLPSRGAGRAVRCVRLRVASTAW